MSGTGTATVLKVTEKSTNTPSGAASCLHGAVPCDIGAAPASLCRARRGLPAEVEDVVVEVLPPP
jgi:hypothetical protein